MAQPAAAHAPLVQLHALHSGTAIVQYDRKLASADAVAQRARAAGASRTVRYRALPFVTVRGPAATLRRIASLRSVRAIHMDRRLSYHLHESVPIAYGGVNPQPTWTAGFDGRGINVAVVDSGVDGLHPDLQNRVVANFKVLLDQVVQCPTACNSDTTGGHGTHVAGIIAGDGTASGGYYRGMAPGAGIVGFSAGEAIAITDAIGAFDYILTHNKELKISVVNNSWGPEGSDSRFDATDPVNVGTKALHDAGITVVFAAGNSGTGDRREAGHEGGSTCDPQATGTCQINVDSVAPWVISVGNTRKDNGPKPGDQALNFSSSRGDPVPEKSLDGSLTIDYKPTLSAPGTNIVAARDQGGTLNAINCGSAEAPSCAPPEGHPEWAVSYMPLSGTSMASPHVAGAAAVLQSYAKVKLGRLLSPDEVKQVLVASARPMTKSDLLWDWPCGSNDLIFVGCGEVQADGMTGKPYVDWQVGAGAMDVTAAMAQVDALPAATTLKAKKPKKKG
ncbi:MAG: serine protease AprX [Thermoleophilaceae bacterium]|nr:serine protease AprX [Thermoleophilaceae bacterium]